MTNQEPVFCDKCRKYYQSESDHIADIMADIKLMIANVPNNRWQRIKEQVEQRRLAL